MSPFVLDKLSVTWSTRTWPSSRSAVNSSRSGGSAYRSNVRGPVDGKVNTDYGGSMVYWNEPGGHQ